MNQESELQIENLTYLGLCEESDANYAVMKSITPEKTSVYFFPSTIIEKLNLEEGNELEFEVEDYILKKDNSQLNLLGLSKTIEKDLKESLSRYPLIGMYIERTETGKGIAKMDLPSGPLNIVFQKGKTDYLEVCGLEKEKEFLWYAGLKTSKFIIPSDKKINEDVEISEIPQGLTFDEVMDFFNH